MKQELSDFTFLTAEQLFGDKQLEILKKYGMRMAVSDFSILLGGYAGFDGEYTSEGNDLKDRAGYYFSSSSDGTGFVCAVDYYGSRNYYSPYDRNATARPALPYSNISLISRNVVRGSNGVDEIEYGEYPQQAVDKRLQETLEREHQARRLKVTGKTYTTDSREYDDYDNGFQAQQHQEYEYNGKKYVRVVISTLCSDPTVIANGVSVKVGDTVWVEVQPIRWLVDEKAKILVSKRGIFAGVRVNPSGTYKDEHFKTSEIKRFMDNYFSKDIKPSKTLGQVAQEENQTQETSRKKNPYNFDFREVSEEDIIRGSVESGVAVFLHGQSSEGKSARVKQLDPDLEIIYLRNATPDSLNGKSVYNPESGEMIDVPPTWYKKLKERCDAEPDKIHIVFFDEITNALPAIQGMAYNIVLDREVNGLWKLPDNARVVAAGNDYNDSLAANQLAEPLFNRFVHVYIQTSVEDWLKWAMAADNKPERIDYEDNKPERKIHPSIYAYIAFKGESALRSPYAGDKPNADPRKWEMASLLLYKTGQPKMLRGLVGDDLTEDFINFCNQQVITLQDVIDGKYNSNDLEMSTDEKWATTVGLSYVDEKNVKNVRNFVSRFGPELVAIFDSLWINGDERRMEKISELRLLPTEASHNPEGGFKR